MSTAQSVISETSSEGSVSTLRRQPFRVIDTTISEMGAPLTAENRDRILNRIPSQHPNIKPRGSSTPSIMRSSSTSMTMTNTIMTPATADDQSTMSREVGGSKEPEDDDLDIEVVRMMFQKGADHMVKSEFAAAEKFFSSALKRARSMRTKNCSLLAVNEQELRLAYSKLYQGKTHNLLAKINKLEKRYTSNSSTLLRIRALYAVAQIYVYDRNYEHAESACRQVIKDLRAHFGEDSRSHVIHRRSLALLVAVYHSKGDTAEASAFSRTPTSGIIYPKEFKNG